MDLDHSTASTTPQSRGIVLRQFAKSSASRAFLSLNETHLHQSYENLLKIRLRASLEAQSVAARQLYLALYQAIALDNPSARRYYDLTLGLHHELLSQMEPSLFRENVRERTEVLRELSPDKFESAAFKAGKLAIPS